MFYQLFTFYILTHTEAAQAGPKGGEIKNDVDGKSCALDCKNGGSCELLNLGDKYEPHCKCKRGWTGETCSTCLGRLESVATTEIQTIRDGYGNYSSSYQAKCSWLIEAPPHPDSTKNYSIELNVTSFETECGWDHLYVFDGTSAYDSTLIAALCGIMKHPPTIYARSGFAFLHFYSDMAYNMSGFNINYRLVESIPQIEPDPASVSAGSFGTWTQRKMFPGDMPSRAMPSAIAQGDIIYIWGGYQFKQNDNDIFDSNVWTFNTKKGIFNKVDAKNYEDQQYSSGLPPVRYGAPVTNLGKTHFLLYGGVTYPEHNLLNDVWRYQYETNTWEELHTSTKPLKAKLIK